MNISKEQYYHRQVLLPEIGEEGQQKLENSKVLVVGAGGLGCPVLEYLVRAGVGCIGLADGDTVDISNLHRQSLYTVEDVGRSKVFTAKQRLEKINPFVSVEAFDAMLSSDNALEIIAGYDIVVDATDNYPVRYLINDACVVLGKPIVYGAIYRFEGQVSVFNYQGSATYRCVFPQYPLSASETNCAIAGVLGILPGVIGMMQANEVVKIITDDSTVLKNKLLTYSAKTGQTSLVRLKREDAFDYSGLVQGNSLQHPYYFKNCNWVSEVSPVDLLQDLENDTDLAFIDVRDPEEEPWFNAASVHSFPLKTIENISNLPFSEKLVVFCRSGVRSRIAQEKLTERFPGRAIFSLKGGITQEIIQVWNKKQ